MSGDSSVVVAVAVKRVIAVAMEGAEVEAAEAAAGVVVAAEVHARVAGHSDVALRLEAR